MALSIELDKTIDKDASGAIRRAQRKRIEDAMDKGFAVSQEHVPEDRGTLRQSGFAPTWTGDGSLVFGYRASHAAPQEYGTQPFAPPLEPILDWAERVIGDRSAGYAVHQKIQKEGIDAQPYMQPSAEAAKDWLKSNEFSRYLEREL